MISPLLPSFSPPMTPYPRWGIEKKALTEPKDDLQPLKIVDKVGQSSGLARG
jgi:hypothetical protein